MTIVVEIVHNAALQNCFGSFLTSRKPTAASSSNFGVFFAQKSDESAPPVPIQVFGGTGSVPFRFLQVNPLFGRNLGFDEGDQVVLQPAEVILPCAMLEIEPTTSSDWQVLEATATVVEELFLDQIRYLCVGMSFMLFIAPGVPVSFVVVSTNPKLATRLQAVQVSNSTEVLVVPKPGPFSTPPTTSNSNILNDALFKLPDAEISPIQHLTISSASAHHRYFRILPVTWSSEDYDLLKLPALQHFVAISSKWIPRPSGTKIARIRLLDHKFAALDEAVTVFVIPVDADALNDDRFRFLETTPNCCFVSPSLIAAGFEPYRWVHDELLTFSELSRVDNLRCIISGDVQASEILDEVGTNFLFSALQKQLRARFSKEAVYLPCLLPLTLDFTLDVEGRHWVYKATLEPLDPVEGQAFFFPDDLPRRITFEAATTSPRPTNPTCSPDWLEDTKLPFSFQQSVIDELINLFRRLKSAKVLLTGHQSSGRSSVATMIARSLQKDHSVYCTVLDSGTFKSKSLSSITDRLELAIQALRCRRPALLVLDNLDFLNTVPDDQDRVKFVRCIYKEITELLESSEISVLAICRSGASLSDALTVFDGRRFFDRTIAIPEMSQDDRIQVLAHILSRPSTEILSNTRDDEIKRGLDGLSLGDLVKVGERMHHEVRRLQGEGAVVDHAVLLERVLQATPTAGRHVSKAGDGGERRVTFADVGGYHGAKARLTEVFIWPGKYPALFTACGLKVGGGALLHGPSGCGKTLLARALAAECGFNVVSVKGPELLSKYIGASEENVRQVFERARSNRPSLIIFDEFDALAPKRGHDSTGVTDRVVNQLLAELDGVDSFKDGIYVLATTSRADLIDDAVIRPGRLDDKILIEFPDVEERREILELLTTDLCADNTGFSFEEIAKATESWTGADLRGLVVDAGFKANEDGTTVTQEHLLSALTENAKRVAAARAKANRTQQRPTLLFGDQKVTLA